MNFNMELHLKIIGIFLMILAFIHIFFPKYFNWKEEFKRMSLITSQMIVSHTFFIAFTVFLMGLLCFTSPFEIIETKLGNKLSLGFGVFWGIRLFFQLFIYSSKLWKGKTFETSIHILFTLLWMYMTIVFLCIFFTS